MGRIGYGGASGARSMRRRRRAVDGLARDADTALGGPANRERIDTALFRQIAVTIEPRLVGVIENHNGIQILSACRQQFLSVHQ